ncbi:MAG: hypothetical protein JXB07_16585 [Anaerolineae bacterium]|nr:hypothetical protein [Anaerolineae bacterium]
MKYWALLVAFLYCLIIVVLTWPVIIIAFWPNVQAADLVGIFSAEAWPYWLFVAVPGLCQVALLTIPVGIAEHRPIARRSLILPIVVAGFMMGGLVIGAMFSLEEFVSKGATLHYREALIVGGLTWILWTVIFYRLSRNEAPGDLISRLCRYLLGGSILELLIAVPTHIVARSRDYCCAGFMTFIGITLGISVMLFSYGPGVFFLFADRWARLYQHRRPDDESASG